MEEIKLKFVGSAPISREKPFEDSEFLYFQIKTSFGKKKLKKLSEYLEDWNIEEPGVGDAYFTEARELEAKTYFSLRMNYRSTPPLSKEESTQFLNDIIESFNIFFNEAEWLK